MTASDPRSLNKRDLTSGSLVGNLLSMALPLAAGNVLGAMYNLVDAFWLGRVSKEAVAAPGVSGPFIWMAVSFAIGFGSGGTALVAQLTGAKRHGEADHVGAQVLSMMTLWSAFIAVPLIIVAPLVLRVFQVPDEVMPQGTTYFRIIAVGLPLMSLTMAYGAVLRALGDTVTVIVIGVVTNIINAVLDPLFIFGMGPVPAMGVGGAAAATVLSQGLGALACLWLIRRHHAGFAIRKYHLPPDWPILKQIFNIGLPAALNNSGGAAGFAIFQTMINTLGPTVIAAYTIGFRLLRFFQIPGEVLAMSAAPIVGQSLGAGKPQTAVRAIKTSAAIVALVTLVPTILVTLEGQWVASFFVKDPGVVAETGRFFLIVPFSSYLFSVIMVLMAAFFGSGHTRPALALTVLRMWVLRLPASYLLTFTLGLGSLGAYLGMVVGNVFGAAATYALFARGTWLKPIISPAKAKAAEVAAELVEP